MRNNPLLALVAAVALTAALAITVGGDPAPESSAYAAAPRDLVISSTSTTIDLVIAADEVKALVLSATEVALTEEAANATTTTTTIASTTTTTAAAAAKPNPSSPTTTQPPATTTSTAATQTGQFRSDYEAEFRGLINSLRASKGLPALTNEGSLASTARSWAKHMSDNDELAHHSVGSLLPPWHAAGENIGVGGSVSAIFNALAASGGHLSVMLGDYTHFGVGVYQDADGTLWTSHVFTR